MDTGWLNEWNHDYERDPYWCLKQDNYDTKYIKYKLNLEVKEYFLRSVQNIDCRLYDGAILIPQKLSVQGNKVTYATNVAREPGYIMTLNFVGLNLRKDHNLHACCNLQTYSPTTKRFEPVSNEVCFSKEVQRVKCDG